MVIVISGFTGQSRFIYCTSDDRMSPPNNLRRRGNMRPHCWTSRVKNSFKYVVSSKGDFCDPGCTCCLCVKLKPTDQLHVRRAGTCCHLERQWPLRLLYPAHLHLNLSARPHMETLNKWATTWCWMSGSWSRRRSQLSQRSRGLNKNQRRHSTQQWLKNNNYFFSNIFLFG